jgi:16S rRNA (cytosine1402-N4)-methyltransferase
MKDEYHIPVLLKEVIDFLRVKENREYIDATLGGGGHTKAILKKGGKVLGIDVDEEAIGFVSKTQKEEIEKGSLVLEKGNFKDIGEIAHLKDFNKVWGILFDLGVSSHQIDIPERGFSFLKEGPLDMRMDQELSVRAADLLNILTKGEIYEIFYNLGQERNAWAISGAILRARRIAPIKTISDLTGIINGVYKIREGDIDNFKKNEIYKRVFQGLRIAVNSELENITEGLGQSIELLNPGGRIAVISFHSLEDKIVKEKFKLFEERSMGKVITEKPVVPSEQEIKENSRSASSKLRVFERN